MQNWLRTPWPWYVGGPMITLVMALMFFFGKTFGISSTLKTMCSMAGGGRWSEYFRIDWKQGIWNLFFVAGTLIGGYLASTYMTEAATINLNPDTVTYLEEHGIADPGASMLPESVFNWQNLFSLQGFIFMILGGFLVGFGTRYAEGCTSGHAITGLSNLQWPSLVAVIGFFIGGLVVIHLVLPYIL